MFLIEPAEAADLPAVVALSAATLPERYDDAFFLSMRELAGDTFLVARHIATEEVAAFAVAVRESPHEARLLLLTTDPAHRNTGLGGRLLRQLEMRLRRHGVMAFDLEVRADNVDAIAFYRRKGYQLARSVPGFYSDGASAFVMWKGL